MSGTMGREREVVIPITRKPKNLVGPQDGIGKSQTPPPPALRTGNGELTLSKSGSLGAPKTKGGGGTLCPPSKNPVTLLRIHSSKLFLKACPKMNLLTQLWFPWKPWLGF